MPESTPQRGHRKERIGEVVSHKMDKTIIVRVERRFRHTQYKKVLTRYKKYYVHDEKNEAQAGDRVQIEETRPISRTKCWRLVAVLERAEAPAPAAA